MLGGCLTPRPWCPCALLCEATLHILPCVSNAPLPVMTTAVPAAGTAGGREGVTADGKADRLPEAPQQPPPPSSGGLNDDPGHELATGGLYESAEKVCSSRGVWACLWEGTRLRRV